MIAARKPPLMVVVRRPWLPRAASRRPELMPPQAVRAPQSPMWKGDGIRVLRIARCPISFRRYPGPSDRQAPPQVWASPELRRTGAESASMETTTETACTKDGRPTLIGTFGEPGDHSRPRHRSRRAPPHGRPSARSNSRPVTCATSPVRSRANPAGSPPLIQGED